MKITPRQKDFVYQLVDDIFWTLKAKLLGRFFKGPFLYFEVARRTNPLETLEGIYRYALHMVHGGGAEVDHDMIQHLSEISGNYIEAQRLKTRNHVITDISQADDVKELEANIKEQMDKAYTYVDQLLTTEVQTTQAYANRDGIQQVASSIGVEDPVVVKLGVVDDKLCDSCRELWHSPDNIWVPRAYKLSELSEGYNKDKNNPIPTIGPTHPHCFVDPNVPILTINGWVKLGNVKVGDSVLTHRGRFRQVTGLINEEYKYGKVLVVSYDYCGKRLNVRVTPDHQFMTSGQRWVEAQELSKHDSLTSLVHRCPVCYRDMTRQLSGRQFNAQTACSSTCIAKLMAMDQDHYDESIFGSADLGEIFGISVKPTHAGPGGRVYCLVVDEDESFIAQGLVSHNCRHTLTFVAPNYGFDEKGRVKYMGLGYDFYKEQNED